MIKIEDLEVGSILVDNSTTKNRYRVLGIYGEMVAISLRERHLIYSHSFSIYTINDGFTLEAPERWYDITIEEFPKYFNKKMWMWGAILNPRYISLRGMYENENTPYISYNGDTYSHCSPIKPS